MGCGNAQHDTPVKYPFSDLPVPQNLGAPQAMPAPDDAECFALWDKYEMLDNVRAHSLRVAQIATALAMRAMELGIIADYRPTRASALLHDIAKTYCVRHGGDHAMYGGAWTVLETGDYAIAQGVILHVHWPWKLPEGDLICSLPIFVLYADKRVRHDQCVSLDERFEDLLARYGKTEKAVKGIRGSHEQAKIIERALATRLKWNLNENTFDCGRLVE